MKIGIIGCGYVGQAMATAWQQQGHFITVTTRHKEKINALKQFADQVILLDNHSSFSSFINQQDVLLICVAPDSHSNYRATYLKIAGQVAQNLSKNSPLKKIIYTSSTSVYEDRQGAWVDENASLEPHEERVQILHETEKTLLECATADLGVCIFRLGEIYGPDREIENRLRKMQAQPFAGNGETYTNLIHLTDVVQALDFALKNNLQGIYNLCSDFHVWRRDFYHTLCEKHQLAPIQWDASLPQMHGGNKRVSNEKIKKEGFVFTHPDYL